jgi:fatty acid desaturase
MTAQRTSGKGAVLALVSGRGYRAAVDAGAKADKYHGPGKIRDYLSADEVRALHVIAPWRIVLAACAVWLTILAALALYAVFRTPLVFAAAFLVIGTRQLALTHLVHDACHYNISRSKAANDWISDVLFAAPTLISTASYRRQHLPHHAHLGDWLQDTDRRAWYNIRGIRFVYRTLWALLGLEAITTIFAYSKVGALSLERDEQPWRRPLLVLITQAAIFGFCYALGTPLAYFTLWIAPLFTVTMYLLVLRVIAEHQTEDYARSQADAFTRSIDEPLTRTVQPGPLGRHVLGSCNFYFHHEHHLLPGVPYAALPRLHALLRERGYYEVYREALGPGYASTLWRLVFPRTRAARG